MRLTSFLFLAMVELWIGEGESLEHLRLYGVYDCGVHWRETAGLFGELGVKVAHGFLPTLQGR